MKQLTKQKYFKSKKYLQIKKDKKPIKLHNYCMSLKLCTNKNSNISQHYPSKKKKNTVLYRN